ncbi:HPr family phosphocarrier protein [Brenneria roseae subsp. americana]|uniref:Phosphocarrier protein NPr n=1 Tax=Brenneria roseae subsp. americana TaxID=1508507 RepID=A0A2U1TQN8_9GAMM|nr:HPr family phosphocarrier protein [Brenneria roseae]PWC11708.1 HPr family phosphocarrier protein [Brenneria roseae subsp. americana]
MLKEKITVRNKNGLHARPATILAKLSRRYQSKIELVYKDKIIKVKGIVGILSAGISGGSTLEVVCDGDDEQDAMCEIKALFASGFGEE